MAVSPDPITGAGLAFVSHFFLDYIGESSIGTVRESASIEGALLGFFVSASLLTATPWLFMLGWVMGNLPDLIDKPCRWFLGRPEWFSCHNGRGLFQYKGRKLGYPTLISLTKEQTIMINCGSVVLWMLIALFL